MGWSNDDKGEDKGKGGREGDAVGQGKVGEGGEAG